MASGFLQILISILVLHISRLLICNIQQDDGAETICQTSSGRLQLSRPAADNHYHHLPIRRLVIVKPSSQEPLVLKAFVGLVESFRGPT